MISTRFWLWLLGFAQIVLLLVIICSHFSLLSRLPTNNTRQPQSEQSQSNSEKPAVQQKPKWFQELEDLNPVGPAIQALSGVAVAVFTGLLLVASVGGWWVAKQSADAATESNRISRNALIADLRPWVSLSVRLAGPIERQNDPGATRHDWHVRLIYELHNHGKTPATFVHPWPKLIPSTSGYFTGGVDENGIPQGELVEGTNVAKEVETACRSTRQIRGHARQIGMGFGNVVFPGHTHRGACRLPFPEEGTPEPMNYLGQYVIVFGVTYSSTLTTDIEDYKTAEAFSLWKKTGDQRLKYTGEAVTVEELGFVLYPFGTGSLAS